MSQLQPTVMDNLEMSEILTAARKYSRGKILPGKGGRKLFIVSCIFVSVWVFSCVPLVPA